MAFVFKVVCLLAVLFVEGSGMKIMRADEENMKPKSKYVKGMIKQMAKKMKKSKKMKKQKKTQQPAGYVTMAKRQACPNGAGITTSDACQTAAQALGIDWNNCCQNEDNIPYGCLKRSDGDIIFNGKQDALKQLSDMDNVVAVCNQPTYLTGTSSSCPSGFSPITDMSECEAAMTDMDKPPCHNSGQSELDKMKLSAEEPISHDAPGCFLRDGTNVCFNPSTTSSAEDHEVNKQMLICKMSQVAYQLGGGNSASCPSGFSLITDIDECNAARTSMSKESCHGGKTKEEMKLTADNQAIDHDAPGCFLRDDTNVCFNPSTTSSAEANENRDENHKVICTNSR
jgi:hypothetical protein